MSIHPSMWIPPVIRIGRTVRIAAVRKRASPTDRLRIEKPHQTTPPRTTPTRGKKHIIYRESPSPRIFGMGILENMENAAISDLNIDSIPVLSLVF